MDFTRCDVTVNGQTHSGQWKRNSILLVVKAFVESGVSLLEIRDIFRELGRGTVFFEVPGEISDVQEFCSRASERSKETGKSFNERRWHTGDGDLIVFDGNTYAFSNQRGRHSLKFMKELRERYPQIGLSYKPSDAIS